ncbi:hypothetical protein PSN45_000313 [Yamadazyma tenuis]|uniref:Nucleoside hydrolase n=1 Tax=Candida tenuis (strain ATCC 10573 / BCRC 21748 / CBS 615 / JCM 9827 / NBRC 10315 / NRRL Y-1498 / VKM Y-70) TaxID=590646 RepID=G3B7J9_CANTC|nr:nucleoside hydrolase [Yamadazyma tenuis ATCC 10573]XP_006688764.1 uncharacterized protein CANTEDRAFT_115094 [Yamadazyma tenuis ATCC 10573]EGV62593.1 nucleoside hydrolase [Yamadazyma tenuis ATCC 10573]EGV62594.1 hypothetical protein CANTEDRAFT_115094 [Yamadazyma tenuis ATCC 10573]WEJ92855.1 hypothetical protein PSN45_000313 [Yamadazyma tenuis]
MSPRKVIIDTDPGIDDSSALMLALAPGNLDVKAITTVSGNLLASTCTKNAKKVLSLLGKADIPMGQGPEKPIARPFPRDPFFHGSDGLADLNMPDLEKSGWENISPEVAYAPDLIVDTVNQHEGDITFIALGPLTNLALACLKDPQLPQKISKVIIIGGSFGFNSVEALHATGDNPVSEWNIYVDPEAADFVFKADFNLTAIGMDIFCQPCIAMNQQHRIALKGSKSPAAKFVMGVLEFLSSRGQGDYCALIDALAVAYAIDESIMTTQKVDVAVECESKLSLGQIIVDRRKNFKWEGLPTIDAVDTVDGEKYLEILVGSFLRIE